MTDHADRYFVAALAFATIVVWATVGAAVALLAAAACAAIALSPRLRRPVVSRPRPQRRPARYELVPDDPSLVFSLSE